MALKSSALRFGGDGDPQSVSRSIVLHKNHVFAKLTMGKLTIFAE